jgi:hypothetical protein
MIPAHAADGWIGEVGSAWEAASKKCELICLCRTARPVRVGIRPLKILYSLSPRRFLSAEMALVKHFAGLEWAHRKLNSCSFAYPRKKRASQRTGHAKRHRPVTESRRGLLHEARPHWWRLHPPFHIHFAYLSSGIGRPGAGAGNAVCPSVLLMSL